MLIIQRLGEATDHFAQGEVEQLDLALKDAQAQSQPGGSGNRSGTSSGLSDMTGLLQHVPGAGTLAREAGELQAQSDQQEQAIEETARYDAPPNAAGSATEGAVQNIPGTNIDPLKVAKQIYPILEFRDKVVKMINATIEKVPGLEALVTKITDTLNLFILSLLAPFVRPIINAISHQLTSGSGGIIDASGRSQYEPWTDPHCSDPTHSLLSKDHFSNILNEPAGLVATSILQYVAPRIIYAWEHPDVPVEQVMDDIVRVFHHPALRDNNCEVHRNMFNTVERWMRSRPDGGRNLDTLLGSDSVRHGKNHTVPDTHSNTHTHSHNSFPGQPGSLPGQLGNFFGAGSHSKTAGSPWARLTQTREMGPEDENPGASISAAYPGMQTEYDTQRPPGGPQVGYAAQQQPSPQPLQDPYAAPPYPPAGPPPPTGYYGQQPPIQQEWQQGYPGQAPPGPPPYQYGYGGPPPPGQYGFDPTAPPPQQGYGYQGPPPRPYYG